MSRSELRFTGERLHPDAALFGADLARHRAAYRHAVDVARESGAKRILELGSGTGYGTAELARALSARAVRVVAIDRVAPLASARDSGASFVRADLGAVPLMPGRFDLVVSFQVIEHLPDPGPYLRAMAEMLRPGGLALITTPNRLESDGENPFHVREYDARELEDLLRPFFAEVEMRGVSAIGAARSYHEARLAQIRRLIRLDPLGLRRRIPRALVEWLFPRLARLVRRAIAGGSDGMPRVDLEDFPIEAAHPRSLDLLALCRRRRD